MSFIPCSECSNLSDVTAGAIVGRVVCPVCRAKATRKAEVTQSAEVEELARVEGNGVPVGPGQPSKMMLLLLGQLRELALLENHYVLTPADRHAVEMARCMYGTIRAVDVDKLRQKSLLENLG